MARILLAFLAIVGVVLGMGKAEAQNAVPVYVEVKLGGSFLTAGNMENTSNVANPATVNVRSADETVFALGGAIGYNWKPRFNAPVRTDVEYIYRTALDYSANPTFTNAAVPTRIKSDLNVHTLLANAYWDIGTWNRLTPFIGGGLGAAFNHTDMDGTVIATGATKNYTKTTTEFAWAAGGGINFAISGGWSADLAYRYMDLGKAKFGDRTDGEITSKDVHTHEVLLGLRYQF